MSGQRDTQAALPPGMNLYPLYRRIGGAHGRPGRVPKILPVPGFDPRTFWPVESRYTDYAIPALIIIIVVFVVIIVVVIIIIVVVIIIVAVITIVVVIIIIVVVVIIIFI